MYFIMKLNDCLKTNLEKVKKSLNNNSKNKLT